MKKGDLDTLLGGLERPQRVGQSYKVAVIIRPDTNWIYNALRFPTQEEAQEYINTRVTLIPGIEDWLIEPSEDPPNMAEGRWLG